MTNGNGNVRAGTFSEPLNLELLLFDVYPVNSSVDESICSTRIKSGQIYWLHIG